MFNVRVFLSQSGKGIASHAVALVLHKWVGKVIHFTDPSCLLTVYTPGNAGMTF